MIRSFEPIWAPDKQAKQFKPAKCDQIIKEFKPVKLQVGLTRHGHDQIQLEKGYG